MHRIQAAQLLCLAGSVDDSLISVLTIWLDSDDLHLRIASANLLAMLGVDRNQIIPRLISCLEVDEIALRLSFIKLLSDLNVLIGSGIIDLLLPVLVGQDDNLRNLAKDLLRSAVQMSIEAESSECITGLLVAMKFGDCALKVQIAEVLLSFISREVSDDSAPIEHIVELIADCVSNESEEVQLHALFLLLQFEGPSERVMTGLNSCLTSHNENIRMTAAELLYRQGLLNDEIVAPLSAWLMHPLSEYRVEAMKILRGFADDGEFNMLRTAAIEHLHPTPDVVVTICKHVKSHESLSIEDEALLAELVTFQKDDSAEQSWARRWLFEWLWWTNDSGSIASPDSYEL